MPKETAEACPFIWFSRTSKILWATMPPRFHKHILRYELREAERAQRRRVAERITRRALQQHRSRQGQALKDHDADNA